MKERDQRNALCSCNSPAYTCGDGHNTREEQLCEKKTIGWEELFMSANSSAVSH